MKYYLTILILFVGLSFAQDVILTPEQIAIKKAKLSLEFDKMEETIGKAKNIIKQAEVRKLELRGQFQLYLELEDSVKPKDDSEDKE